MGITWKATSGMCMGSLKSGTVSQPKLLTGNRIRTAVHCGLLLSAVLSNPQASRCQATSVVTTAPMSMESNHEMVAIPCHINGIKRRYTCVIDSGATYTIVSDRLLKAEGPTTNLTTGNGVIHVRQREVSLTIADGLELKSNALVQSGMVQGIDILVGQDVLRQFKFVMFDYLNHKVEFQR